eukprot:m.76793 g.76793  ORF g.76793 m.76793 type:complete len:1009 (+) comp12581_c0_seq1:112-3138(+)
MGHIVLFALILFGCCYFSCSGNTLRLRVNQATSPNAVTMTHGAPVLSWIVGSSSRAQIVTRSEVMVLRDDKVIWNTSMQGNGTQVEYNVDGKASEDLMPDTDYSWTVRWCDGNGNMSNWAQTAQFSTALFTESDWLGAEWLAMNGPAKQSPHVDTDYAYQFRTTIKSSVTSNGATVTRCSLAISGLGYYKAWIEGKIVGDHELGESMQFNNQLPYDMHNCTAHVQQALSRETAQDIPMFTIAVALGRGWYGQQTVVALGNIPSGPRMLRLVMKLTYSDGQTEQIISSPKTWKRGHGPIVWEALHLGIVYDARLETPGWQLSTYNDDNWIPALSPGNITNNKSSLLDGATMTASVHPTIRKTQEITPQKITPVVGTNKTWVIDVGQNIAGWCQFRLPTKGVAMGTNVTFMHGERLNLNNGTITHAIQPLTQGAYEQTVYIFGNTSTSDYVTFEPMFVSYGFRYVQLEGDLPSPPTLSNITCWFVHTDLQQIGSFSFPNTTTDKTEVGAVQQALQDNYNAVIQTARANYISYPTDCPHRERRGWLGDAQASAGSFLTRFDMGAAYTKWLDDIKFAAARMYFDGDFPTLAPNYASPNQAPTPTLHPGRTATAWSSAFVLVWDWTWRWYGDLGLAARHYERAKDYVDHLANHTDHTTHILPVTWQGTGLLGDWCAALGVNGTGGPDAVFSPRHASGIFDTFYYIRVLEALLRAHQALGKDESSADLYKQRLQNAKSGFNFVFYDREQQIYRDEVVAKDVDTYGQEPLQSALALALTVQVADLPHVNNTEGVLNSLINDVVHTQGNRLTTGLIGTKYLLPVLSQGGAIDTAIALATQQQDPSWGYMLQQGPGTLWEQWFGNASYVRPRGSLNHIMLGSQGPWFYEYLGGLQLPDNSVGWNTANIAPKVTAKLSGFTASLLTVKGLLTSSWSWLNNDKSSKFGGYTHNVTIPMNTVASVTFNSRAQTIAESGTTVFDQGHFFPNSVTGVTMGGVSATGSIWLQVLNGNYSFVVK